MEKLCTVVILLISMIFFSYVLDQFIFILQKDPSPKQVIQTVDEAKGRLELQKFLQSLLRYIQFKPLPLSLV